MGGGGFFSSEWKGTCGGMSVSLTITNSVQLSIARRENERTRLGESGERFVVAFRESPYLATIRKISPGIRMNVARTSLEIRIFLSTREGSLRVSLSLAASEALDAPGVLLDTAPLSLDALGHEAHFRHSGDYVMPPLD